MEKTLDTTPLAAFANCDTLLGPLHMYMGHLLQAKAERSIALTQAKSSLVKQAPAIWQDPATALATLEHELGTANADDILFAVYQTPERVGALRKTLFGGSRNARTAARKPYQVYRFGMMHEAAVMNALMGEFQTKFAEFGNAMQALHNAMEDAYGHDAVNDAATAADARRTARKMRQAERDSTPRVAFDPFEPENYLPRADA